MYESNRLSALVAGPLLAASLVFSGCTSTGSDSGPTTTFDSGNIAAGETYSYTFENEEDVDYFCEIHAPDMQGTIFVNSSNDSAERDTVIMENEQFSPKQLFIAPHTEVVWINRDSFEHTVTSGNPPSDDGDGGGY